MSRSARYGGYGGYEGYGGYQAYGGHQPDYYRNGEDNFIDLNCYYWLILCNSGDDYYWSQGKKLFLTFGDRESSSKSSLEDYEYTQDYWSKDYSQDYSGKDYMYT